MFTGNNDGILNSAGKYTQRLKSLSVFLSYAHQILDFNDRVPVQTGIWRVLSLMRLFTSFRGKGARAATSPRSMSSHAGIFIRRLRELIGFPSPNALHAVAQLAKQCFDCGNLPSRTANSCGIPSYSTEPARHTVQLGWQSFDFHRDNGLRCRKRTTLAAHHSNHLQPPEKPIHDRELNAVRMFARWV